MRASISSSLSSVKQRPASISLVNYAENLPVLASVEGEYDLVGLVHDLYQKANANSSANVTVIPRLQTFVALLEGETLEKMQHDPAGLELYVSMRTTTLHFADCAYRLGKWISLATRNAARLKNVQRIQLSMKM